MTELQLYKYLKDVEVKIWFHGEERENMESYTDFNRSGWKVYILPRTHQLQELLNLLPKGVFDDDGVRAILKDGYIAVDLMPIVCYSNIDPRNIFD